MKNRDLFVSVLMSVYNADSYLSISIKSILAQTHVNFEFIIINDGSTDNSLQIINSFNDPRIIVINNELNIGLNKSLNIGLGLIKGVYLFRMDADDISVSNRLEEQIALMESYPDLIVCGTLVEEICSKADNITLKTKAREIDKTSIKGKSAFIKASLFFGCPLAHPTICLRTSIIKANFIRYNESIRVGEDYVLYADILQYGDFIVLNSPLLKYRVYQHDSKITKPNNRDNFYQARIIAWKIILDYLNSDSPSDTIFSIHDKLTYYPYFLNEGEFQFIDEYFQFLIGLSEKNSRTSFFQSDYFNKEVILRIYYGLSNNIIPIAIRKELLKKYKSFLSVKSVLKLKLKYLKEQVEQ